MFSSDICDYYFEKPFLCSGFGNSALSLPSLLWADVGMRDVDGEWRGQSLFSNTVRYCTYIFTWLTNLVNVSWLTEVKFDSCQKALHYWPTCQKNQTQKAQNKANMHVIKSMIWILFQFEVGAVTCLETSLCIRVERLLSAVLSVKCKLANVSIPTCWWWTL